MVSQGIVWYGVHGVPATRPHAHCLQRHFPLIRNGKVQLMQVVISWWEESKKAATRRDTRLYKEFRREGPTSTMKANIARPIDRTQRAHGSDKKGKPYKEAEKEQTKKECPTKR